MDTILADKKPIVTKIYQEIIAELDTIGPYEIAVEQQKIKVLRKTQFMVLTPKAKIIDLVLITNKPINHPCLQKSNKITKTCYHNNIRLSKVEDVDFELSYFFELAYNL